MLKGLSPGAKRSLRLGNDADHLVFRRLFRGGKFERLIQRHQFCPLHRWEHHSFTRFEAFLHGGKDTHIHQAFLAVGFWVAAGQDAVREILGLVAELVDGIEGMCRLAVFRFLDKVMPSFAPNMKHGVAWMVAFVPTSVKLSAAAVA